MRSEAEDVLREVMFALHALPICASDFLGKELYARVQYVLGYDEEE